ncbi:aminotransferase class IV [Methylocapsa acidiphila]|uniref:aminotransferase class IV n=1 Tax=Methylocapsa acidiphila TaxID=133552 RepID=UPI0004164BB3|nr:aminotransferase class IV [Methylocapsa acidiphila]
MTRVWLDGRLVAPDRAHVPIADRGLLLGDGLFETMRVHKGRAFDLDGHLARLESGLRILGFARAVDLARLRADVTNYLAAEGASEAALRLTLTRGAGPRGLAPPEEPRPTIVMTLSPLPLARETPVSLWIATSTRRNELSPVSRAKALPYLDNLIALQEARAHGAEDALMLNTRDLVACASVANVFIVRDGRLETPPISDGALPGRMRALLLDLAGEAGLTPMEGSLCPDALAGADHMLLTNSIRGVVEAGSCNGAALQRRAGVVVARLRALIAARVERA